MTDKGFYDWQTAGGTNDVMRLVDCLERSDVPWCVIGGVAVNHWAEEPMVTKDVNFVVAAEEVQRVIDELAAAGFGHERFEWSVNFRGDSTLSIQLTTAEEYKDFPGRAEAADVHGILLRVSSLRDTLEGKLLAWSDRSRRQSKRAKDFADIVRLVEAHPALWSGLPESLRSQIDQPESR